MGYSREELIRITFQDVTYPELTAANLKQFVALMRGDSPRLSMEKPIHCDPCGRSGPLHRCQICGLGIFSSTSSQGFMNFSNVSSSRSPPAGSAIIMNVPVGEPSPLIPLRITP